MTKNPTSIAPGESDGEVATKVVPLKSSVTSLLAVCPYCDGALQS